MSVQESRKVRRTKEGYIRVWRICKNRRYNGFNDEPKHVVVPYAIIDEREKSYNVVRLGWGFGKKQQRRMAKDEFYFSPEEAEAALKGRKTGENRNKGADGQLRGGGEVQG